MDVITSPTIQRSVKQMTNERAVEILNLDLDILGQYGDETAEAYKMAIQALEAQPSEDDFVKHKKEVLERIAKREREIDKYIKELEALEQQPSEDCVSRSELQKTMDSLPLFRFVNNDHEEADDYYNCESVDMVIRNLPSVKPTYTDEEIDKAQAVEQAYVDKMVELAVKETKRPKGHWIIIDDCELFMAKCSECGEIVDSRMINKYPYCHCGAEMEGEE